MKHLRSLPTPLRVVAPPKPEDHLAQLLEEVLCNVLDNRTDVAITNLTHAVRVASEGSVSERVDVLLRRINALGGGFA
jgi:hypothetical protein